MRSHIRDYAPAADARSGAPSDHHDHGSHGFAGNRKQRRATASIQRKAFKAAMRTIRQRMAKSPPDARAPQADPPPGPPDGGPVGG